MRSTTLIFVGLFAFVILGCGARDTAQVCSESTEIQDYESYYEFGFGSWGLGLLVVIDSSESMGSAQSKAASALFTLVNSAMNPDIENGWRWSMMGIESLRVAVVTSDMGLQYGEEHITEGFPYGTEAPTCTDQAPRGDDGRFQTDMPDSVEIDDGLQVDCPTLEGTWAENGWGEDNDGLATEVACLSQVGTDGCMIGQPLEAAVRGLSIVKDDFLSEEYLLAVLIISDKDDCSIADPGLFETPEWSSGIVADADDSETGLLTTACNMPASNEDNYLFSELSIWEQLVHIMNFEWAVHFGAIVGVPAGEDSPCQGTGDELEGCLEREDMQLKIGLKDKGDYMTRGFEPACELKDGDSVLISASPGRRYVELAQSFGSRGYVSSICGDMNESMKEFAEMIVRHWGFSTCFEKKIEWIPLSIKQQEQLNCENCGVSECQLIETYVYAADHTGPLCPEEFNVDPENIAIEPLKDDTGQVMAIEAYCPVPKLPAELDCDLAVARSKASNQVGWYYCEDHDENFDEACSDSIDNDGIGGTDCEDEKCRDCIVCGGIDADCDFSCKFFVGWTESTEQFTSGRMFLQCAKHLPSLDENCLENTPAACSDGVDNDGDRTFDCDEGLTWDAYLQPDPDCCPMRVEGDACVVEPAAFENCGGDPGNLPDACEAHAKKLDCALSI